VRGKVDKRRETPSIMVSDAIPVTDAVAKLTTSVGVKLDRTKHPVDVLKDLQAVLAKHKGTREVYMQVGTGDGKKVSMRLNKELSVKPTPAMVEDLEQLLGSGAVELFGDGTKRMKRLAQQQQQQLFKDATADDATAQPIDTATAIEADIAEYVPAGDEITD
jgi:hypothetical protein